MKKTLALIALGLFLLAWSGFKSESSFEPVAVVELFTSEGCSSCPPADVLLAKTIHESYLNRTKVFALSFHVDYWNHLGWKDPFSDAQYTARQKVYDDILKSSTYTPQVVVNGNNGFIGSDETKLNNAMKEALSVKSEAVFKSLYLTHTNDNVWTAHYELDGDYKDCKLNFALVFEKESSAVKKGENGGKVLNESNIVRQFITLKAASSGKVDFSKTPLTDRMNMDIIAYVQRNSDQHIIGAASVKP